MTDLPSGGMLSGRYRIDREIGREAMATVFRAHDTLLDRPVTVKVLQAATTDDEAVRTLLVEAPDVRVARQVLVEAGSIVTRLAGQLDAPDDRAAFEQSPIVRDVAGQLEALPV